MTPEAFIAEVYRRMALRTTPSQRQPPSQRLIEDVAREYAGFLPARKDAAILDMGYGDGWFMAACLSLGYTNISGAEFAPERKEYMQQWNVKLHRIESDIGEFLRLHPGEYDFIHMSHVIEHIPKYSLLWVGDALFQALKIGGVLLLRTPNMEGPFANSSLYVTLTHEYGFAGANLSSLLSVCGFDDFQLHTPPMRERGLRQKFGRIVRWPFSQQGRMMNRLFGVNFGGQFGGELIATARRGDFAPLFDERYR